MVKRDFSDDEDACAIWRNGRYTSGVSGGQISARVEALSAQEEKQPRAWTKIRKEKPSFAVIAMLAIAWGAGQVLYHAWMIVWPWTAQVEVAETYRRDMQSRLERSTSWRSLSPEERSRIKIQLDGFSYTLAALPPEDLRDETRLMPTVKHELQLLVESYPQWRQLTPQEQEQIRRDTTGPQIMAEMINRSFEHVEGGRPLHQGIRWIELVLGLSWIAMGLRLRSGNLKTGLLASTLAVVTLVWSFAVPFLAVGLAERRLMAEQTLLWNEYFAGSPVNSLAMVQDLGHGAVVVTVGIKRILANVLGSLLVLWYVNREVIRVTGDERFLR